MPLIDLPEPRAVLFRRFPCGARGYYCFVCPHFSPDGENFYTHLMARHSKFVTSSVERRDGWKAKYRRYYGDQEIDDTQVERALGNLRLHVESTNKDFVIMPFVFAANVSRLPYLCGFCGKRFYKRAAMKHSIRKHLVLSFVEVAPRKRKGRSIVCQENFGLLHDLAVATSCIIEGRAPKYIPPCPPNYESPE